MIELLCVIAIISMLFYLSIPRLTKTAENFYFTAKARQIEYLLNYLKKTAALENRGYKLSLDLNNNSYSVYAETDDPDADYMQYVLVNDSLLGKKTLPEGLSFKTTTDFKQLIEIVFQPKGNISAQEFLLTDKQQHSAKFQTTFSGQITLEYI